MKTAKTKGVTGNELSFFVEDTTKPRLLMFLSKAFTLFAILRDVPVILTKVLNVGRLTQASRFCAKMLVQEKCTNYLQ